MFVHIYLTQTDLTYILHDLAELPGGRARREGGRGGIEEGSGVVKRQMLMNTRWQKPSLLDSS